MTTTDTDIPTQTWPTLPDGRYAVLRCCQPDGTSSHGFRWPLDVGATVEAPDWDPTPERDCGGGLHGLLWGCGAAGLLDPLDGAWMVVAVDPSDIATPYDDVPDKVRFRAGEVVHVGDQASATGWLIERAPGLLFVTATAGDRGTATAGNWGTATAGHWGTATAGHGGTATAGHWGTATAGDWGTATAGDWGTATAGHWGTATAGHGGTATAGNGGTATAGNGGTATAGNGGTATAGHGGCISILRWDGKAYRRQIAEVDGTTIRAGVAYQLDGDGNFVEVER